MRNIFILCFLFTIVSCVKDVQDIPPQLTSNPIFKAEILIDGEPTNLNVGSDNLVMLTEIGLTSDSVGFHTSSILPANCNLDCWPSLQFKFYESSTTLATPGENIEETLPLGNKEYLYDIPMEDSIKIALSILSDAATNSAWFWNNGINSLNSSLTSFELKVASKEESYICLNTVTPTFAGANCLTQKCLRFIPAQSPNGCNAILKATQIQNGSYVLLTAEGQGEGPFQYDWGQGIQSEYLLLPVHDSTFKFVSLSLTDATGCKTILNQIVLIHQNTVEVCPLDYNLSLTEIPGIQTSFHSKVEIKYVDRDGQIFNSSSQLPTTAQFFEILEVADFDSAPNGLATKKIVVAFDGSFYNAALEKTITIKSSGEVILAVGYEK